jgi:hypothetical protein
VPSLAWIWGFFLNAEHQSTVGYVEVEPDDIPYLVNEGRIARQLEDLAPMRLQAEGSPDPRHYGLTHADPLRHPARRPVRRSHRLAVQCQRDHRLDGFVAKLPRCPAARSIRKPFQPVRQEALSPGDDALALTLSRSAIAMLVASYRALAGSASTHQALQRLAFLCRQNQCRRLRPARHDRLLSETAQPTLPQSE